MNDERYYTRATFLWEKGTDRSLVLAGVKNKYSWVDVGSSFLISDILAALLYDQLTNKEDLQEMRKKLNDKYSEFFIEADIERVNYLTIPPDVGSNYHAFWIEFKNDLERERFIAEMAENQVAAYIGYVPLHTSPKGQEVGVTKQDLIVTNNAGRALVRLPFYIMNDIEINKVISCLEEYFNRKCI